MAGREAEAPQVRDAEAGICTETLARLYLQQGFVERALLIYRRLAQEQPDNQPLHARLQAVEQQFVLETSGQEAVVQHTIPTPAAETASMAPQPHREAVVAQLERWLHCLQRQRQPAECP